MGNRKVYEQQSLKRGHHHAPSVDIDMDQCYRYKFRPSTCPERRGLTASAHEIGYLAFNGTRMALIGDHEKVVEEAILTCGEDWPKGFHFTDTAGAALQLYAGQMEESAEEHGDDNGIRYMPHEKIAVLMIAIPHDAIIESIRQGNVERANPKSRTKGWNWKSCSGMTRHFHRMYICEDICEAAELTDFMDAEDLAGQARTRWERRDVNNGAPKWWSMTWSKWCSQCSCSHDTKKRKP